MSDTRRIAYGSHPDQWVDVHSPASASVGIAVVIHGGFWRSAYDASLGEPLCVDLAQRGWTACNVEYRRLGRGGGWPETLQDVSDAIDSLAQLPTELTRVVAVGHSAGGHLATWAAARHRLSPPAPGADPRVAVTGVVAQAGVLDLRTGVATHVGGSAISDLLGGLPSKVAQRYDWADPLTLVPLEIPVVCIHSRGDDDVPFAQSAAYVTAATAAGGRAELVEFEGDHMAHVDVASVAWAAALDAMAML